MIDWLDSAYPPSEAQVAAAKAAGVGGWAGYFAGTFILNGWSQADFERVKAGGLRTLAYCSGWSDPAAMKAQGAAWGVTICLDVEGGIRGDGPWVQSWLDAAGSGLYGNDPCHAGRNAAFHILAAYPTSGDPGGNDWSAAYVRPAGPCGWQWAGSHDFAGATVDSSWFDDAIALLGFGPGAGSLGETMARLVYGDTGVGDPHGNGAQYVTDGIVKRYNGDPAATAGYEALFGALQVVNQGMLNDIPEAVDTAAQLAEILAAIKAIQPAAGGLTQAQAQELSDILNRLSSLTLKAA